MVIDHWRRWFARASSARLIAIYLKTSDYPCLNIGCGWNLLDGWLNVDIDPRLGAIFLDASSPLSFPDNQFKAIFCEHVVEHLAPAELDRLLRECWRVLLPGGIIRIATPDLDFFLKMVADPCTPDARRYLEWFSARHPGNKISPEVAAINTIFYGHGHRNLLNQRALTEVLVGAGFVNPCRESAGNSRHQFLLGVEGHGKVIGEDINRLESLVLEAERP